MTNFKNENLNIERLEALTQEIEEIENKIMELYKNREDNSIEWYRANVKPLSERQDYCKELVRRIKNFNVKVGDGVTICLYSDKHACTVIKRTAKSITVQRDKATLDPSFKPKMEVGGFAGHCTNQNEQTYTYERDENGQVSTFRWSDKYGSFRSSGDQSIGIINGRHEFYDYNF